MKWKQVNNKPELIIFRKEQRSNSTSAEATLWLQLQKSKISGRKFRRQHSIGNFIADFYCPSEKLVVELDGEAHFWEDGMKRDNEKEAFFITMGIKVIRFENKFVFEDLNWVLETIRNNFLHTDEKSGITTPDQGCRHPWSAPPPL